VTTTAAPSARLLTVRADCWRLRRERSVCVLNGLPVTVQSTRAVVRDTLTMAGFDEFSEQRRAGSSDAASSKDAVVDAFVRFRSDVRQVCGAPIPSPAPRGPNLYVLSQVPPGVAQTALKSLKSSGGACASDVLALCDTARQVTLPGLGVRVVDTQKQQ
jgi:hypothetical protein